MFNIEYVNHKKIIFDGQALLGSKETSRTIFKTKDYVIKLDDYHNSDYSVYHQSRNEANFYEKVKNNSKYNKYFVPVLQSGIIGGVDYVVQPRIKLARGRRPIWASELTERIGYELGLIDVSCNPSNWTVQGNNLLIFDYGLFSSANKSSKYKERKNKMDKEKEHYNLRVWWNPDIPLAEEVFYYPVKDLDEAIFVMNLLMKYDLFQEETKVRSDFTNSGGLERYNHEGQYWEDWYDESGCTINDLTGLF